METHNEFFREAKKFHENTEVVDLHCDTMHLVTTGKLKLMDWNKTGHVDVPRLKAGGVKYQVFAAWGEGQPEPTWKIAYETLKAFRDIVNQNINEISIVERWDDIQRCRKDNLIGAILGMESGMLLNGKLDRLYTIYDLGVRILTLTWNGRNQIADGVGVEGEKKGLTQFGREVVKSMYELGMIVDISHLGEPGFWDCIEYVESPIIASHSNCYALCPHPRNLKDAQIKAMAEKGGVIGVNFYPAFLGDPVDVSRVCDHIDYIANIVGIDYIALGSDFDGMDVTPKGLEDVSKFPNITAELIVRGYSDDDICKILGKNALKIFKRI